jgi:hypothetical protein
MPIFHRSEQRGLTTLDNLLNEMKLDSLFWGISWKYMIQNRGGILPTEPLLKKPPFHQGCGGGNFNTIASEFWLRWQNIKKSLLLASPPNALGHTLPHLSFFGVSSFLILPPLLSLAPLPLPPLLLLFSRLSSRGGELLSSARVRRRRQRCCRHIARLCEDSGPAIDLLQGIRHKFRLQSLLE